MTFSLSVRGCRDRTHTCTVRYQQCRPQGCRSTFRKGTSYVYWQHWVPLTTCMPIGGGVRRHTQHSHLCASAESGTGVRSTTLLSLHRLVIFPLNCHRGRAPLRGARDLNRR